MIGWFSRLPEEWLGGRVFYHQPSLHETVLKETQELHTDLRARRVRTRAPFFNAGLAFDDSEIVSRIKANELARALQEFDDVKYGLCFTQTV